MGTFIASGGYGSVYLYGDTVIKRFHDPINKKDILDREDMINKIDPNRKYFGSQVIDIKNIYTISMKYDGVSLDTLLKTPSEDVLVKLFFLSYQILNASDLLYRSKLIHGDIKIANILFNDKTNRIKLIDFDFLNTQNVYQAYQKKQKYIYPEVDYSTMYFAWPFQRFNFKKIKICQYSIHILKDIGLLPGTDDLRLMAFLRKEPTHYKGKPGWWLKCFLELYDGRTVSKDYMKIDIYSVGIVLGELFLHKGFDYLLPSLRRPIKNYIHHGLLHPDPSKRYDPPKAIQFWNFIFQDYLKPGFYQDYYSAVQKKTLNMPLFVIVHQEINKEDSNVLLMDLLFIIERITDPRLRTKLLLHLFKKNDEKYKLHEYIAHIFRHDFSPSRSYMMEVCKTLESYYLAKLQIK